MGRKSRRRKNDFWNEMVVVGGLLAAGVYCFSKFNDMSVPVNPAVVSAVTSKSTDVSQPEKVEVKPVVSEPKQLEQIVVDEKTGLAVVQPRDSFQFYGERVLQGGKYRQVDKELYGLLAKMADAYKVEFNQRLFVGPMWDDKGHTSNSKHYKGLAVDIDFGANVGTAQYEKEDRKKAEFLLRYVQKYVKEHNKDFKVLFNDQDFIKEGLCSFFEGHHNHIHVSK
jgi:hypothetical protein